MAECSHIGAVVRSPGLLGPPPSADGCQDCLPDRTDWVHLRRCLVCGRILCCEDSPGAHARAHALGTEHGLIQSFEPGEDWIWCYLCDLGLWVEGAQGSPSHT